MKPAIKNVRLWTLRVPLPHAVYLGRLRIAQREFAVAQIEDDAGHIGWGATLTRDKPVERMAQQHFVSLVSGRAIDESETVWREMMDIAARQEQRNTAMRAVSILDIALWDLRAKIARQPLHEFLGGGAPEVNVMVVGGYRSEDEGARGLLSELNFYKSQGVRRLKLMFTAEEILAHPENLIEARRIMGDQVMLGNDFTGNGRDVATVLDALRAVKSARLDFIEDPFSHRDLASYRGLRSKIDCGVMTGEQADDFGEATALAAAGVVDLVRWDATACGGITGWLQWHAMSSAKGLGVCPHVFPEIHAPLIAAKAQPCVESTMPPYDTMNFSALLDEPLVVREGKCQLSKRPGLGREFMPEKAMPFVVKQNWGGPN